MAEFVVGCLLLVMVGVGLIVAVFCVFKIWRNQHASTKRQRLLIVASLAMLVVGYVPWPWSLTGTGWVRWAFVLVFAIVTVFNVYSNSGRSKR